MTGPNNVIDHILYYETKAGIISSPNSWPRTEAELLHLQRQDPRLKSIIANLRFLHMIELNTLHSSTTPRSVPEILMDYDDPTSIPLNLQRTPFVEISGRLYYLP